MNNKGYRISAEVFNTEQFRQYKQYFESRPKYSIEIKGQPINGRAVVYFAEMAYLLLERGIIATNLDTNAEEILPGGEYARSYIEGFNAGVAHFIESYSLMPDTLYGPKSDHYFNDLRAAYEGTGDRDTPPELLSNEMRSGWLEEAGRITLLPFNDESVKNNGYYAGLVSKYRELELKHDRLRVKPEAGKTKKRFSTLLDACGTERRGKLRERFVDMGLCDSVSFAWLDNKKGSGKLLITYLLELHTKGYCDRKLTAPEIVEIAKNDFKKVDGAGIDNVYDTTRNPLQPSQVLAYCNT